VRLFAERAAAVAPGFELAGATADAAAQICRRLDGLPLAIELAATRTSALGAEQIAARLDDRFSLLTGGSRTALPRHQTLRAVVDWSYETLTAPERRLFEELSVFVGGFGLEAAEGVCDPGDAVPEVLTHLVDKSLVSAEHGGTASYRYRLLETLRAYGLERLGEHGGADRVRARHAAWFLGLAAEAAEGLRGPRQGDWLDRLAADHDNLRAALDWSLETGDTETAARMAASLYQFWDLRGFYNEGCYLLDVVLEAGQPIQPATLVRVMIAAGTLAAITGLVDKAAALCQEAAGLAEAAGDTVGLAHALQYLGFMSVHGGELDHGQALLEESLALARAAGAAWLEGWSLLFLAELAVARDNPDAAIELADATDAVLRPVGDQEAPAWTMTIRAAAAWRRGDLPAAVEWVRAALKGFHALGGLWGLSLSLFVAGALATSAGRWQRAATLFGASESVREAVGAALPPFVAVWLDEGVAGARAALGPETFERAWASGQALGADAAMDEAMRGLDAAGP
jgi:non-specific serine/threonine protein kinase